MLRTITHYWWVILLRGIFAILFGIAAFIWPGPTIEVLVLLFGAYALLDGIFAAIVGGVFEIAAAVALRKAIEGEWMMILAGAASVVFGVLMVLQPAAGALALVWLIGAYAIIFGV